MASTPPVNPGTMQRAAPAQLRDYAELCTVRAMELEKFSRREEARRFREMAAHFRAMIPPTERQNNLL